MSDDSAMIHNHGMIVNNLNLLVVNKCMISADLKGKNTMLTAIISVEYKNNTLILDTSASDDLNKKMVASRNVRFFTVFNGVQVAFTCSDITMGKYKGHEVFIMPIPNSLYWYNRREYYRVTTPMLKPCVCNIPLVAPQEDPTVENYKPLYATDKYKAAYKSALLLIKQKLLEKIKQDLQAEEENFNKAYAKMSVENKIKAKHEREALEKERIENPIVPDESMLNVMQLPLYDISLSGFSVVNIDEPFAYFLQPGASYKECEIIMPEHGNLNANFEIMECHPIHLEGNTHKDDDFSELVGAKFGDLVQSSVTVVFRYIQAMDRKKANK